MASWESPRGPELCLRVGPQTWSPAPGCVTGRACSAGAHSQERRRRGTQLTGDPPRSPLSGTGADWIRDLPRCLPHCHPCLLWHFLGPPVAGGPCRAGSRLSPCREWLLAQMVYVPTRVLAFSPAVHLCDPFRGSAASLCGRSGVRCLGRAGNALPWMSAGSRTRAASHTARKVPHSQGPPCLSPSGSASVAPEGVSRGGGCHRTCRRPSAQPPSPPASLPPGSGPFWSAGCSESAIDAVFKTTILSPSVFCLWRRATSSGPAPH